MAVSWQALCLVLAVGHALAVEDPFTIVTREAKPKSGPQCERLGQYLAHERFCRRFYHCGHERFEFRCAEGTLWDESLPGCNADRAVKSPTPVGCPDLEKSVDGSTSGGSSTQGDSGTQIDQSTSGTAADELTTDGTTAPDDWDFESDSSDSSSDEYDIPSAN